MAAAACSDTLCVQSQPSPQPVVCVVHADAKRSQLADLMSPRVPDTCGGARGGVASTSAPQCPSSRTNRIPALAQSGGSGLVNAGNRCRPASRASSLHVVKHSHARQPAGLTLPSHLYSTESHPSITAANSEDRPQGQPHAGKGARHGARRPTPGATAPFPASVGIALARRSTRPLTFFVG